MIAALILFILAYALTALPAIRQAEKRVRVMWWHLGFPFSGLVAWFLFEGLGLGDTAGPSNLVLELFWIAGISLASAWGFWACSHLPERLASRVCNLLTLVPLLTAFALRATMPTISL